MPEREHTCCFTGHREYKLPWGSDEEDLRCQAVKTILAQRLEQAGKNTVGRYLLANLAGLAVVYAMGMVYYYIICNYVINTPIALWPLFLYCFLLAVPGDLCLSVLGAVLVKRVKPALSHTALGRV